MCIRDRVRTYTKLYTLLHVNRDIYNRLCTSGTARRSQHGSSLSTDLPASTDTNATPTARGRRDRADAGAFTGRPASNGQPPPAPQRRPPEAGAASTASDNSTASAPSFTTARAAAAPAQRGRLAAPASLARLLRVLAGRERADDPSPDHPPPRGDATVHSTDTIATTRAACP